MSGNHSRRKGANYERELVWLFAEALAGIEVKRGLQSRSGSEVPDVDAPPFWVESKRGLRPPVRAALKQVTAEAPAARIPLAVIRDDREKPFVVMLLDDFLDLISEWHELRSA